MLEIIMAVVISTTTLKTPKDKNKGKRR